MGIGASARRRFNTIFQEMLVSSVLTPLQRRIKHYFSSCNLNFCRLGLRSNGILVVKENITSSNNLEMDKEDSSITRSMKTLQSLFDKADLICVKEQQQTKFPSGLYPVYMFALRPRNYGSELADV